MGELYLLWYPVDHDRVAVNDHMLEVGRVFEEGVIIEIGQFRGVVRMTRVLTSRDLARVIDGVIGGMAHAF